MTAVTLSRLLQLVLVTLWKIPSINGGSVPVYILTPDQSFTVENIPLFPTDVGETMREYKESRKYKIQPNPVTNNNPRPHIKGTFPLTCEEVHVPENKTQSPATNQTRRRRRRRQATGNHLVEFLLFLDHELYKFWLGRNGGNSTLTKFVISDYYANIINHMNRRFLTATRPGFSIQVVLSGLFIAEIQGTSPWTESIAANGRADADAALTAFQTFVANSVATLPPHDHAQLVTGYDLTRGGSPGNAGLAYTPSVCTNKAVSVVEETRSQAVATVMAHELGHSLGSFHDGDGNSCSSSDSFIMDSGLGIPTRANQANPWIFSTCSVSMMRNNIASLLPVCTLSLQGTPINITPFLGVELGQKYPADIQCEIFLGAGSKVCRGDYNSGNGLTYDDMCYELRCLDPGSGSCFPTYAHDGTTCGNKKWCFSGTCIATALAPATPDNCPVGDDPDTTCTIVSCANTVLASGPCCSTCSSLGVTGVTPTTTNVNTRRRPTQSNVQRRPTQSNVQPRSTFSPLSAEVRSRVRTGF